MTVGQVGEFFRWVLSGSGENINGHVIRRRTSSSNVTPGNSQVSAENDSESNKFSLSKLAISSARLPSAKREMLESDRQMILTVLFENPAFCELSNDQRTALVESFGQVDILKDDVLFRQGDYGNLFYIIGKGSCDVYIEQSGVHNGGGKKVARLGQGASFGELALMYSGYRKATLVANDDTQLWTLDKRTFLQHTPSSSSELKKIFDKFALSSPTITAVNESVPDAWPQKYMDVHGFISAFTQSNLEDDDTHDPSIINIDYDINRLHMLFAILDRFNTGFITFEDFASFAHIMSNPDPEFEIAFRYFDRLNRGLISKSQFKHVLLNNHNGSTNSSVNNNESTGDMDAISGFNFECDLMLHYFGTEDAPKELTFYDFAEFFVSFQAEHAQQLFTHYESIHGKGGFVPLSVFTQRVLPYITDSKTINYFPEFCKVLRRADRVHYSEFIALQKFLRHISPVERTLVTIFNHYPNATINKNTFRALIRANAVTTFTPLEASLFFQVYGIQRNTIITRESFLKRATHTHFAENIWCQSDGTLQIDDNNEQPRRSNINYQMYSVSSDDTPTIIEEIPVHHGIDQKQYYNGMPQENTSNGTNSGTNNGGVSSSPMALSELFRAKVYNFISPTNQFIGFLATGMTCLAIFPIDTIKTRMQYNRQYPYVSSVSFYKSHWDCVRLSYNSHGLRGFYRGAGPVVVGMMPEKTFKLLLNTYLRHVFEDKSKGDNYLPLEMLAGAGAGMGASLLTNPYEIVKIRMQLSKEPVKLISIIKELGFSGLYRGFGACLLRDSIFSAIYFPTYAALKRMAITNQSKQGHERSTPTIMNARTLFMAGALAAIPAVIFTTPLDVIKTRLQAKPFTTGNYLLNKNIKYKSIADCVIKTVKFEGPSALYKGLIPRLIIWCPQFAGTLLAYEYIQRIVAPDIPPAPYTHIPINSSDFMALRRPHLLTERLGKVEGDLRVLSQLNLNHNNHIDANMNNRILSQDALLQEFRHTDFYETASTNPRGPIAS